MKVFLESSIECTVDGVGLLEPGKPVEVNPELFRMYHQVNPAQANFPKTITVTYDTADQEEVEEAEDEQEEEE